MKEVLNFLTEVNPDILERNLGVKELVEIYNATTGEEVRQYNSTIELFLENNVVPQNDLRMAVSFFYLKCHLLENNLIKNAT